MPFARTHRLTTRGAKQMMAAAIAKAEEFGIPVTVAIADAGGHLVLRERMDGGRFHTVHFVHHEGGLLGLEQAAHHHAGRAGAAPGHRPRLRARSRRRPQSGGRRWRAASRFFMRASAWAASA